MNKLRPKTFIGALLLSFTLLILGGCASGPAPKDKLTIVTSFYPMYLATLNVTQGVEGVELINLTSPQTGCLHDYQLTTKDMKTLAEADILVVNGGGMESFLAKATAENKNLKIIDASQDERINFIKEGDEINPHVWMSLTYAKYQAEAITFQLCALDPAHDKDYRRNCLEYVNKIDALKAQMHDQLTGLKQRDIVTFHEAFPYFAKEFKLNIVAVIQREPGTEPTPQELTELIDKVKALPTKALFTEPQYSPTAAEVIARETGAKLFSLDPIVTGEATPDAKDAYLNAMENNAAVLAEALDE